MLVAPEPRKYLRRPGRCGQWFGRSSGVGQQQQSLGRANRESTGEPACQSNRGRAWYDHATTGPTPSPVWRGRSVRDTGQGCGDQFASRGRIGEHEAYRCSVAGSALRLPGGGSHRLHIPIAHPSVWCDVGLNAVANAPGDRSHHRCRPGGVCRTHDLLPARPRRLVRPGGCNRVDGASAVFTRHRPFSSTATRVTRG